MLITTTRLPTPMTAIRCTTRSLEKIRPEIHVKAFATCCMGSMVVDFLSDEQTGASAYSQTRYPQRTLNVLLVGRCRLLELEGLLRIGEWADC